MALPVHAQKQVYRVGLIGEVENLDPRLPYTAAEQMVADNITDTLLRRNIKNGELEPFAAKSMKVSADGLQITFELRNDLFYHDGTPVYAQDYVRGLQRHLEKGKDSPLHPLLSVIRGGREMMEGVFFHPDKLGIHSKLQGKTQTLIIELTQPAPLMIQWFASPYTAPIAEKPLAQWGEQLYAQPTIWSSGPYVFERKAPNKIILTPNRHHRLFNTLSVHEVQMLLYSGNQQAEKDFLKRKIDQYGAMDMPLTDKTMGKLKGSDYLHYAPDFRTYFVRFQANRLPTSQFKIRQALAMAVERDWLLANVSYHEEKAAHAMMPPLDIQYNPPHTFYYDLEGARDILKQMGYCVTAASKDVCLPLPTLRITYPNRALPQKMAVALSIQWKKLGFQTIELEPQSETSFVEDIAQGRFMLAIDELAALPIARFDLLHAFESSRATSQGVATKVFDELVQKAQAAATYSEAMAGYRQSESYLLREALALPLIYPMQPVLLHTSVQGWKPNAWNIQYFDAITLVPTTTKKLNT
jgi:ABC-type oligopeptide transport system substrate-binding subunit